MVLIDNKVNRYSTHFKMESIADRIDRVSFTFLCSKSKYKIMKKTIHALLSIVLLINTSTN